MRYPVLVAITCLFSFFIIPGASAQEKTPLIFDTDMGPDYDDVGAIALLHALADSNQVNILATIASTKYAGVVPVLNILNTYFNRASVPVGVARGNAVNQRDTQHWSDTLIARYPHTIKSNEEATEAVELYRKILAARPDNTVTIVTVGFLTNLAGLLQSPGDKYSPYPGTELVRRKVKLLVSMAGRFPAGNEFNVREDAAASKLVFERWPSKIILSGFEIGQKIKTGLPLVKNASIKNSPVKDVYRISIPLAKQDSAGRMSWDQTAVLVGVKGYAPWYKLHQGTMVVNADGTNSWTDSGSRHAYLVENLPFSDVAAYINKLMQHQPSNNR
ncbi:nucleoside hydrolase [Flavitalea sp.]|nr:nucleoside hydrolase [Flavitalea sp.]